MARWYRFEVLRRMEENVFVPTINVDSIDKYAHVAESLLKGGIPVMEILQRSLPGAIPRVHLDAIYQMRCKFPEMLIGAGTVQTAERAQAVIDNGAQFVVSNLMEPSVIEQANLNGVLVIPATRDDAGVRTALRLGCHVVKLFIPMPGLDVQVNIKYLKLYQGTFPAMAFMLTHGVTFATVRECLKAGFPLLAPDGIAPSEVVEKKEWGEITRIAQAYVGEVETFRKVAPALI